MKANNKPGPTPLWPIGAFFVVIFVIDILNNRLPVMWAIICALVALAIESSNRKRFGKEYRKNPVLTKEGKEYYSSTFWQRFLASGRRYKYFFYAFGALVLFVLILFVIFAIKGT